MTLSEQIAADMLWRLGFRFPHKLEQWDDLVGVVQLHIDRAMEAMKRIAGNDAIPSRAHILQYETHSSLWAGWVGWRWLQSLAGSYFAWKVQRKYARYQRQLQIKERLSRLADRRSA